MPGNMKVKQYKVRHIHTQNKTFFANVRNVLIVGRVMGFVPITGLFGADSKNTRCTWKSLYTLYYVHNVALRSFILSLQLINVMSSYTLKDNYYQNKMHILITSLTLFLTIHVSIFCKKWRNMMDEIEGIEQLIPITARRFSINGNRVVIFIFTLTAVEHTVYIVYTILNSCVYEMPRAVCSVRGYYEYHYDFAFNVIPFTYFAACVLQISKYQRTFLITLIDAMIVSVTLYLMNRFKDFNYALSLRLKKCTYDKSVQWRDLQAYYTRLSKLVRAVDDRYNTFVFISFAINLIYICKNIYVYIQYHRRNFKNSTENVHPVTESITWIEVVHLLVFNVSIMVKALMTFTSTAYLHTLTREPLHALHTIPATAYTPQFQRFMDQVYQSKVHLSGLKMFYISRNTILSVISTVITYELVLIQLPDNERV